ncbi:MAG: glycosyltransferase family 4 protein [Methylococcales bacterium]|nr:glycosyltransferase family 4 protein [Methylococcales bacterium]
MSTSTIVKPCVIHVVRRYGPVGGMERYVWELTQELKALGFAVTVICERCHAEKPDGILIHELGEIAMRPRWLASYRFGNRVARWLEKNPHPKHIIHSHERLKCHHITTYHGPPFATVFEKPWWKRLSFRILMHLKMEQWELFTPNYIVPNSSFIKQQLSHYYPNIISKLTHPIVPGVKPIHSREVLSVPNNGGVVGFVGYEWKRKGLEFAAQIVAELRKHRSDVQFCIVGPATEDIKHIFTDWDVAAYKLMGWSDDSLYHHFDVLLHPAKAEPYGMVISEAMSAKVPVVVSDVCGAAEQVTPSFGLVLDLTAPIETWVAAVEQQLNRVDFAPQFERSWRNVAQEYGAIYNEFFESRFK